MTKRFASSVTGWRQSRSFGAPVICLALIGTLAFPVFWLSPLILGGPAQAQSNAERLKENSEKLKQLKTDLAKNLEEKASLNELEKNKLLKERDQKRLKELVKKNKDDKERILEDIDVRSQEKSDVAEIIIKAEINLRIANNARRKSKEETDKLYCNKNATEKEKKDIQRKHKQINRTYYKAKERLRQIKHLADDRFGPGEIERYRGAKRRATETYRSFAPLPGDESIYDDEQFFNEYFHSDGTRRAEKRRDGVFDDTFLRGSLINPMYLKCEPDETGKPTSLTFPAEPKTINIAVQLPEVCVGTTYILTEETVFEEHVPVVTEDEEDPRDVPVAKEIPGDEDEPGDVPVTDLPVTLTPEDEDGPRDTPQEDAPVVSIPDGEDEPRDVPREETPTPAVSTPEDDPRDVPQEDVPDLGLVKAVSEVVALALVDEGTGAPVTDVAVKLLPEEPPLPGSEVAEAPNEDGTFDDASFFEDDAEGGFTGEDGEIELASKASGSGTPSETGGPDAAIGESARVRRLALNVDTELREQHVAGLPGPAPEGGALTLAMSDAVLAPYVVSAFSVGAQPVAVLSVPKSEVEYLKQQVKAANTVSWFEPDPCWSKQEIDDPYFSSKGLWGQDYDDQWAVKRAGFSEEIIESARGNAAAKPVTVAVIDTGIDWIHPDLDEKSLWRNDGEVPDNGIDDDGNGYVDDVIGWNFINQNNKPWDYDGHGTFIAGVIGAASGNGTGIAGVNPHARLMPLKALDPFGQGYASMVAEAILYAADNGAKVINISLGGKGISRVVDLAIAHAVSKGALVVVAAGNEATDVSGFGPAGSEGVITVSATDQRDRRAGFSNWGEEVDIAAPGVDVMSLRARGTDLLAVIRGVDYNKGEGIIGEPRAYYRASGTSFAAPIVSGAASLIMSLNPDLDADAVRRMLLNTARDIEVPGIDNYAGYGLIDVASALGADPEYNVESRITGAAPVRVDGKSVLRLVGTANADDFAEATLSLGKGKEPSKWLTIKTRITEPVEEDVLMDIPAAALKGAKEWTIRLITKHKDGTEREARFAVTLG